MKNIILLLISFLLFSINVHAEEPGQVQITCGTLQQGLGIQFQIYPLTRTLKYIAYHDGKPLTSGTFKPSEGIYNKSSLDFSGNSSGNDTFQSEISIHGSYSQFLRINYFSAITIKLAKNWNTNKYYLSEFSEGGLTTSSFDPPVKEETHPEFNGLECSISNS